MKDTNMQYMTMREYVSIAVLAEAVLDPDVKVNLVKGKITPEQVVKESFNWAEVWCKERESRLAKT